MKLFTILFTFFVIYNPINAQDVDDIKASLSEFAVGLMDNQIGIGSRAIGLGGAYVGVSDDGSALFWNPAGLAQIRSREISGAISHFNYENDVNFSGSILNNKDSQSQINSFSLAFPIPVSQGSLVFSLGYFRIRNFDANDSYNGRIDLNINNENFQVEQEADVINEGQLNIWSFGGAVDLTKNFSVGAALNIFTGNENYSVDFRDTDIEDSFTYTQFSEEQSIKDNFSSANIKVGGLWRAGTLFRLGATITTPTTFNIDEDWTNNYREIYDEGAVEVDVNDENSGFVDYNIKVPFSFASGASFNLGRILIAGDVEYNDWSQTEYENSVPVEGIASTDAVAVRRVNSYISDNYRSTLKSRIGLEYLVPFIETKVRFGYQNQPSPLKNAPDGYTRNFYTLGIGMLVDKNLMVDLSYIEGSWKRTSEDGLADFGRDEDISISKIFASISYRF